MREGGGPIEKYKMREGGSEKKVFHPSHILLNGIALMNVGLVHFQFFICTCPGPSGFHDFDFSKIKNIISAGTREELLVLNMNGNVLRRLDYVDLSGGPAQFDCFLITPQNEVSLNRYSLSSYRCRCSFDFISQIKGPIVFC